MQGRAPAVALAAGVGEEQLGLAAGDGLAAAAGAEPRLCHRQAMLEPLHPS